MPAEHHKPKAAFLCEGGSIFNVYDPETLALLEEKLSLSRTVFRKADLEKQPLLLADAEYIFSTWGMPAFTEAEIEKFFPRLQALFYGAGSVRGFAREFLRKGIRVFSAWGANAVPVAEFAVSQIVLAGKGFFQGLRILEREGRAACMQYIGGFPGNYRTKVGILGAGMIGSRVCEMLKAYDFEVLVYDPFAGDDQARGPARAARRIGPDFHRMSDDFKPYRKCSGNGWTAELRLLFENEEKRDIS